MRLPPARRHTGFSLLEVAAATAVFSMGIGGLSLLMMTAVRGTAEARYETVAALQVESLAELIAMNPDVTGHYVAPPAGDFSACNLGSDCAPGEMAAAEIGAWLQQLETSLPGGSGLVCRDSTPADGGPGEPSCDGEGEPVVKVFWEEPGSGTDSDDQDGQRRLVGRLPEP